jgi:hypothetical protein
MINPRDVALFIPPGLKDFKLNLFERIGQTIHRSGGMILRHDLQLLAVLPHGIFPIVGCSPQLQPLYAKWRAEKRNFIYWDRGYLRRVFATWLPRGQNGGYYRWHVNAFQMERIRDVPDDRWRALNIANELRPWRRGGGKIVIADTLPDYWNVRGLPVDWSEQTAALLRTKTDRPIVVRHKESKRPLYDEIKDAHCLVTHGSIAAVEAVVMGCPVFVEQESAAALVGRVGFDDIEHPVYPERQQWLNSLAYHQFNELELVNGTLWKMIE